MSETTLCLSCSGFNLFCLIVNVYLVSRIQKLTDESLKIGSEVLKDAKTIIESMERKNNGNKKF